MNVTVLIDSIVRQTTILIAELATASGTRAPLAHIANQVFLDLVRGLKDQGLGNKVIADMFGMALRTYHDRVQRLSESSTFRGKSLWGAVLEFVQERGTVGRHEVLRRFSQDDGASVRGILADLVDLGLVYRSGRGDQTEYRARRSNEISTEAGNLERISNLVWVAIHRYGPVSASEIAEVIPADAQLLDRAIDKLVAEGRVTREPGQEPMYGCDFCLLGLDEPAGWEAAVFDHYQALVTAITTKLRAGRTRALRSDLVGGSTYTFDIWEEHPHYDEVAGFLRETRNRAVALRSKVDAFNQTQPSPSEEKSRKFIAYVGQTVLDNEALGDRE